MSPSVWINSAGYPGSSQSDWKKKIKNQPHQCVIKVDTENDAIIVKCPWRTIVLNKNKSCSQSFPWFSEKKSILIAKAYISFQVLLFLVFKSYFPVFVYIIFQVIQASLVNMEECDAILWCNFCDVILFSLLPLQKNLLKVHKMLLFVFHTILLLSMPFHPPIQQSVSIPWLLSMLGSH